MGLRCTPQPALGRPSSRAPGPSAAAPHAAAAAGRRSCVAAASRASSTQTPGSSRAPHTHERVLRYPDGNVRYIRYPAEDTLDEDDDDFAAWDVSGLWSWSTARPSPPSALTKHQDPLQQRSHAPKPRLPQKQKQKHKQAAQAPPAAAPETSLADTAAFLESLFTAPPSSRHVEVDVEGSFEVLAGCPWLLPRPVYVLCVGTAPRAEDVGSTYTLQVRVKQQGAASDIAQLLGKRHLAELLEVSQLRDGVVMFEDEGTADRFSSLLEEEGYSQVLVAQVDSHKLFRMAMDVHGLVVLVRGVAGAPPQPYQLAAALKKARAWDER